MKVVGPTGERTLAADEFFLTYLKQGWYTDDYQLIKAMDMLAERTKKLPVGACRRCEQLYGTRHQPGLGG
jgi:hypothetical protein